MLRLGISRTILRQSGIRFKATEASAAPNAMAQSKYDSDHETALKIQEMENFEAALPFSRTRIGPFFQQMPTLGNQYLEDVTLRSYLRRVMPENVIIH